MLKHTLYKQAKTGKTVELTYEIEQDKYRTINGYVGGKLVTSAWTTAKPKNVGRANATDGFQQAVYEVEAKIEKKLKEGYTKDLNRVEHVKPSIKPMLAKKWEDYKDKTSFPVFSQPKLDGIRCIITKDGAFSRMGNPFTTIPHIVEEAQKLLALLPPGIKLDGELYNEQLHDDFNRIVSLVKRDKATPEELEQSRQFIQYHIYDIDDSGVQDFTLRNRLLTNKFGIGQFQYLQLVLTGLVLDSNRLDYLYGNYRYSGYEGQMIRIKNSFYENSRSKGLLKRKEFIDAEFEILSIVKGDGNRDHMAGAIQYKIDCPDFGFDTFSSGIKGGVEFYKRLWKDRHNLAGKKGTVRFQNYTPDGIPRFPVTVAIRDYE